jgi:hypothetical protein
MERRETFADDREGGHNAMNLFRLHMDLFEAESRTDTLNRTLDALGNAICQCKKAIDQAKASGPPEYGDAVTEGECEMVEALLGVAFVASQVSISRVVSRVMAIHRTAGKKIPLTTTGKKKPEIIRIGCQGDGEDQPTEVELIDAFANYFKHRDEWPANWDKLDNRQAQTKKVIESVGAKQGCSGNMRTGAEALGNTGYHDVGIFYRVIGRWEDAVRAGYREELTLKELL